MRQSAGGLQPEARYSASCSRCSMGPPPDWGIDMGRRLWICAQGLAVAEWQRKRAGRPRAPAPDSRAGVVRRREVDARQRRQRVGQRLGAGGAERDRQRRSVLGAQHPGPVGRARPADDLDRDQRREIDEAAALRAESPMRPSSTTTTPGASAAAAEPQPRQRAAQQREARDRGSRSPPRRSAARPGHSRARPAQAPTPAGAPQISASRCRRSASASSGRRKLIASPPGPPATA